jgi:hypothetical protein
LTLTNKPPSRPPSDRETARIDALIEKKNRFVELLKEKRQG